jgi:hypothetical protein
VDFRFAPDELEAHRYARTSVRNHLPLTRLSDPTAELAGWAGFAAEGWTRACLGEDGPDDLPFLAGLAREAGAVAAGEAFVHNGWLLPKLCSHASQPDRGDWLAELAARPGFLEESDHGAPGRAVGDTVRAARPGFGRYRLVSGPLRPARLHRLSPTGSAIDSLGGLSAQLGRPPADDVPGEGATVELPITGGQLAELRAGAAVLRAAGLVGLAAEILATTVTYLGEREQFGQVIGRFQALKHICADVHAQVEVAWLGVLYAAVVADDPVAVDCASYRAASSALDAARAGAQLHGGMGFTWESNLHWLLKAALDGQITAGPTPAVAQRIGTAVVERA